MKEKKENKKNVVSKENEDQNKKAMMLLVAILVVVILAIITLKALDIDRGSKDKIDTSSIISKAETKIIYVGNSDSKVCKKCSKIKKYLDKEDIKYLYYDVKDHKDDEYKNMLRSIEINPDDFGYPAVIYIKEGKLYADAINLREIKPLETFINEYKLKEVK